MARCRYCAHSGWAVRTDDAGLCRACRGSIQDEVSTKLEHVRHALAYVRHAQDPEVLLSLCDVAIESVERLLPYEERRLAEISPLPSSLLMMLQAKKDEASERIVVEPTPLRQLRDGVVLLHQLTGPKRTTTPTDRSGAVIPAPGGATPEVRRWAGESPAGFAPGDGDDRRQDGRVAVDCFAFLLPAGARATLENLSVGGVFLRTDRLQPPGTPLRLVVSATFGPAKAQGIVRWMRTTAGEMGMGIEFTQLSPELLEYLETRLGCTVPAADSATLAIRA